MSLTTVLSIHTRPEKGLEYEDLLRELAERARERNDPGHYSTHQNLFGELGVFHFVTRNDDWSGLSSRGMVQQIIARVMGEEEGRQWSRRSTACIASASHQIAVDRPDLSYPPDGEEPAPMAVVTAARARPGGQEACEELIRKVAEAIPKLDDPTRMVAYQTAIGDLSEYWTVRPLDALDDLDEQRQAQELLVQAFGPSEGGLIWRSGVEAIQEARREIVLLRPDLSNHA